ncbi:hypothetical protein CRENBAI_019609, partial [Crenichthys baileyi]
MYWSCPSLGQFWTDVFYTLSSIFRVAVTPSPLLALIGISGGEVHLPASKRQVLSFCSLLARPVRSRLVEDFCVFAAAGDSYWVFDAERKISGPDSLERLGLPVTDIQAALRWEEDHTEKVYLFKSSFYWSFNVQENRFEDRHPRSIHEWAGLPSHINAAFLDSYGYANFLSGLYYWKFDPVALK